MEVENLQNAAYACTAVAFKHFLEDDDGGYCYYKNPTTFKRAMIDAIVEYDSNYLDRRYNDDGCNKCMKKMAIAIAFTTNKQPKTNEFLTELGFTQTPFFEKDKHPENELTMWWISSRQLLEKLEYKPATDNIGKDK